MPQLQPPTPSAVAGTARSMETARHKRSLAAAGVDAGHWCVHPLPAHTLQVLGVSAQRARLMSWKTIAKKLSEEVPTARTQPTAGGFAEAFFEKRQRVKRLALAAKAAKKEAKRMEHKALHEEVRRRAVAQTRQRLAGATLGSNIYAYCEAARGD